MTPTPSLACTTATVPQDTWVQPATLTGMSAALVRETNVSASLGLASNNQLTISFLSLPSGPNPCEHGGHCVNTDGSFKCNCGRGYTGPRCEQDVNECASSPCQNDGTCLDRIGEYTCICMSGMIRSLAIFIQLSNYIRSVTLERLLELDPKCPFLVVLISSSVQKYAYCKDAQCYRNLLSVLVSHQENKLHHIQATI